ncbi:adenosylcobinamide amidohydrolase [Dehalobacter sp. DCM]|uniref:adenosylcobinamide amidohydrolase n=1 Tax=Dehalobacter sp. DCM TaxID=2907827 RepID=UPI003081B5B3|nr:adenosylcobinamide amidohydrolase [Dehalobacter sp. DCM]
MRLWTFETGDTAERYRDSIVIFFNDERKALSTSHLNGGYRDDLKYVFNHNINSGMGMKQDITCDNYEEHMRLLANELGLDPNASAGLLTAASMENAAIRSETYEDLTVTAIVTGGVVMNGGRVGDPAFFHERQGETVEIKHGTINILLYIDANLPAETMTRALMTCTEAKTAALQELLAGSCYSRGLATGSGTDGAVIICNSKSPSRLIYAGKHSKLGELIGRTVKEAVKEALRLETNLCPESQFSMLKRLCRFGVTAETIWQKYAASPGSEISQGCRSLSDNNTLDKPIFLKTLSHLDRQEELVLLTSFYVHLIDQMDWQLLPPHLAVTEGKNIIRRIEDRYALAHDSLDQLSGSSLAGSIANTVTAMIACFVLTIAKLIRTVETSD